MAATTYAKKSITIPTELLKEAEKIIDDGNFSKLVSELIEHWIAREKLVAMVDEMNERAGHTPSDEEIEAAAIELGFRD